MKLKAGHMVAERYEIDDTIGSGGMSVVYRAHDTKLDRYVTLKVLKEEYLTDDSLMERFPKEARAAAALNHQNITSIFDHGRDGDILYIVLEYVDGASLKELINKKAPFDDETTLGVTIQVTEGLSEAHRNSIIHLDIKPQNILITTTSIVKVADFGIARAAKNVTLNAAAGSMGSVHYFSPEQARGGYIDHKSDIYSLGIVMYEMATGQLPFEGENEVSIALQHINDPLPDILSINPNLSDSIVKIIQKATEKSPSKRYQEIDDMTEDLKLALTDASGAFVGVEENDDGSAETRRISDENREAIRRQKIRQAFLNGEEMPEEEENPAEDGGFLLRNSAEIPARPQTNSPEKYQEGQEYGYQDYTFYPEDYDDYEEPTPAPRDKKADRIAVYGGIILGLILAIIIGMLARHLYNNIFSSSAGMVETPEVVGLPWAQAELSAIMIDLQPHRENRYCHEYCFECDGDCEGIVIYQRTAPGRLATPGDVLHLVVSMGEAGERAIAPRVTNLILEDARAILEALDLDLIIITTDYDDDTIPRNMVVDQNPGANDMLTRGSTVILTVSTGPDDYQVAMPNLIGSTEAEALDILREFSLVPGATERAYSDTFATGRIMRQDPLPGELIERNSVITYVISQGSEEVMPTPEASPEPTPPPQESEDPADTTDPTDTPPDTDPTADPPTEPEPTPTPPPIQMTSGTLEMHLGWYIPEGTETFHLLITRQIGNAAPEPLFNDPNAAVATFPRTLDIEYADPTIFRIYSVEDGVRTLRAVEPRP